MPPMLRRNYARELQAFALLPLMLGAIQAGTMSVVLKKTFTDVPGLSESTLDLLVAALGASAAFGNITSGVWAAIAHGRAKIRFLVWLICSTSLFAGLLAVVPRTAGGAYLFVVLIFAAWICWSGVVTIRTAVWRANYPDADRAKIAGRLATAQVVVLAAAGFIIGQGLDMSPHAFRFIFPLLALFGFVGAARYVRIRLRGQRRLMRMERNGGALDRPSLNPFTIVSVLANDHRYAGYMLCMFIFGTGNLMIGPTLAIVLTDEFNVTYLMGILVTSIIPLLIMPFAIAVWAPLLDRVHVITFRAIHSWSFVLFASLVFLSVQFHLFWLLFVASLAQGIGFGGGVLAWNLGHQHFAPPHRDTQYMSVHVMLTGIRGVIAPFVGVLLYSALAETDRGAYVFLGSVALTVVGAVGFVILQRRLTPA
jgi:MFS family permease